MKNMFINEKMLNYNTLLPIVIVFLYFLINLLNNYPS